LYNFRFGRHCVVFCSRIAGACHPENHALPRSQANIRILNIAVLLVYDPRPTPRFLGGTARTAAGGRGRGSRVSREGSGLAVVKGRPTALIALSMSEKPMSRPLAWLRDSTHECAIQIARRASQPEFDRPCFYAPDFALSDPAPWLIGERVALDLASREWPSVVERQLPLQSEFVQIHAQILDLISSGEFLKVVPMVAEQLRFAQPLHPEMFWRAITGEWPQQYSYGFARHGEGLCGVTPELLFSQQNNRLQTMALAGTAAADGPALLEDRKERHEHQVVVDHIYHELKDLGAVEIGQTVEKIYGRLKHLYTPIEVRLKATPSFADLVQRLHPTAALGGWPRRPALQWLKQQSSQDLRARFGAPFGWQADGEMKCVVAIRCLQWWEDRALICAGCGVVSSSDAAREWRELGMKRQAINQMLGVPV
jgi:menaquinone-specific isochorismate synthase